MIVLLIVNGLCADVRVFYSHMSADMSRFATGVNTFGALILLQMVVPLRMVHQRRQRPVVRHLLLTDL